MENTRTRNSMLIMATSGLRQIVSLIFAFVSRTIFIHILGAEYLGLNGLFSNILSILSLSELGIGTAISFYLYKPVADQDLERIKSLMQFYKICYRVVGLTIIGIGLLLMPFLRYMVNFEQDIPINLHIVFLLNILNFAMSYLFFAYKQALVGANQKQYKIEKINIFFVIVNCLADIIILIVFRSYMVYLVTKIVVTLVKNIVTAYRIDCEFPFLKEKDYEPIQRGEIKSIFKDIWQISIFRIGSVLFDATDNIIISMLMGTLVVGYYSNYLMIISQVKFVVNLVIRSFGAGIGNVVARECKEKQYKVFLELDFVVSFMSTICTVCLFQLLNSFVMLWIGDVNENYVLSQYVVGFLCICFYIETTTQIANAFREASGNFETGKSLQLIGGIVNILLSVIWGKEWGLEGIFCATVVSKFSITLIPFLMGVSRNVFGKGSFGLLKNYMCNVLVLMIDIVVLWGLAFKLHMTTIRGFVLEIILSVFISVVVTTLIDFKRTEMKLLLKRVSGICARRRL